MANKYATINPSDHNDRKALFNLICKDVCIAKKSDVLALLGIEGGSQVIKDYVPDMNDLCKLLEMYDVECDFKIIYSELKVNNTEEYLKHRDNIEEKSVSAMKEMKVCDEYKDMKKQVNEITNPDLKDIPVIPSIDKKDELFSVNITELPDGPDFLS